MGKKTILKVVGGLAFLIFINSSTAWADQEVAYFSCPYVQSKIDDRFYPSFLVHTDAKYDSFVAIKPVGYDTAVVCVLASSADMLLIEKDTHTMRLSGRTAALNYAKALYKDRFPSKAPF